MIEMHISSTSKTPINITHIKSPSFPHSSISRGVLQTRSRIESYCSSTSSSSRGGIFFPSPPMRQNDLIFDIPFSKMTVRKKVGKQNIEERENLTAKKRRMTTDTSNIVRKPVRFGSDQLVIEKKRSTQKNYD